LRGARFTLSTESSCQSAERKPLKPLFNIDKNNQDRENNAVLAKPVRLENFTDKTPLNKNLSLIESFNAERYAIHEKQSKLKHYPNPL
jgi:hypothetical protein